MSLTSPRAVRAIAALLIAAPALADARPQAMARAVTVPPVLDGRLDEPQWAEAAPLQGFRQIDPVPGGEPSEPTTLRILYDARYLYIGAEMHDSRPDEIVRKVMVRQTRLFGEDRLHILLDPFLDRRNGYYFEVNPNGQRADALLENNNRMLAEWDGIWSVRTRVHDSGWTAEIRIPFSTLSFDPAAEVWGLNLFRSIAGRNEFISWAVHGHVDFPYAPGLMGELHGLSGLQQGLGLDLIPSLTLRRQQAFADTVDESLEFEPSLDLLYRVGSASTLALTLNTDFSAAEVDDRQVNLSRFSLFFPEKRLFFLQDAGIFEFGGLSENGRPYFSRTIGLSADGEPLGLAGGLKFTGREGPLNFGVLAVRQDAAESLPRQDLFVGRAVVNLFSASSLGLIATAGDPRADSDNRVAGVDFRFRNDGLPGAGIIEASAWAQRSASRDGQADDEAFGASLRLPNDRWFIDLSARQIGERFDPALGFVNRAGIRQYRGFFQYRQRPQHELWLAHNHWVRADIITGLDDEIETAYLEFVPWAPFSRHFDFYRPLLSHTREVLDEGFALFDRIAVPAGDYRDVFYSLRLESAETRPLRLYLTLGTGGFFGGERDEVSVDLTWRANRHFTLDLDWEWNDARLPGGRFISRLWRLRTAVAFNPQLAWITQLQFDNVSDSLGVDTRLQWLPQAGREVFVVYNRGAIRDGRDRFQSASGEGVIKLVYALRY